MLETYDRPKSALAQGVDGIPIAFGDPSELTETENDISKQDS